MMVFVRKMKEVAICMAPIIALVLILHFSTLTKMDNATFVSFVVGTVLVFGGQIFFLVGVDNGIMPMGEMVGSTVTKKGKLLIVLAFGFVFGFLATFAEPAVQVLGMQVNSVDQNVAPMLLVIVISVGVGLFVSFALFRILKGIKLRTILIVTYLVIFGLGIIIQIITPEFLAVAFDSGGVTTGPVTVPFILALGAGVAAVRAGSKAEDSFGLVGMASAGPILAILIMALFMGGGATTSTEIDFGSAEGFLQTAFSTLLDVTKALSPIIIIFLFFQFAFIKLSRKNLLRLLVNAAVMFVGLLLFLTGVNYGFSATGKFIGEALGSLDYNWIIIPIAGLVGAAVIYTEPSVIVLGKQVEQVTNKHISGKVLLHALAICIAFATALGAARAMYGINLFWFIIPGYVLTIVLMFFSPPIFTAIAFDSGGVASGTLTSTFILPFIIGVCSAMGQNVLLFAFGVVAIIAMMPLLTLQGLGVLYRLKATRVKEQAAEEEARDLITPEEQTALGDELRNDIDFGGMDSEDADVADIDTHSETQTEQPIDGDQPS